jgi:fructose-1,6-bisphosphatase
MRNKNEDWVTAKRKYRLTDVQIQMARELGMNPRKFGSLTNHKQEKWKAPVADFIEELYFEKFRKEKPYTIREMT